MNTCATIGAKLLDGSVEAIHIQLGGNDVGIASILKNHYMLPWQVDLLFSVGNVAQLHDTPSLNMRFPIGHIINPALVCTNYYIEAGKVASFANEEEWLQFFYDCDYGYLYDGRDWTFLKNVMID